MVDPNRHRHSVTQLEECRPRFRWGATNEKSFLDILDADLQRLPATSLTLAPVNSNIYARRHSTHACPVTEDRNVVPPIIPPSVPKRAPAVPKRRHKTTTNNTSETIPVKKPPGQPPPIPPSSKNRVLPPIPSLDSKPKPPARNQVNADSVNVTGLKKSNEINRNPSPKNTQGTRSNFDYGIISQKNQTVHSHTVTKQIKSSNGSAMQNGSAKVSVRQDSGISSDSFSQTSSPSYTTKTMETPLLPPKTPIKNQNGLLAKALAAQEELNANNTIIKSASTPASLQTIVKFHNGSNMSLHHRIIRDIRRPSSHYSQRIKLRFRFAQIILNAVALFAIAAGMAAYFKAFPAEIHIVNATVNITTSPVIERITQNNPAPGICLPVIVNFCQHHKIPYNYTVFPNYMGQFGQRDAQQELEVYDAVVNVRCYELAALFLCSLFVPKCGPGGALVRPCRNLCYETKKRCGFFLDVFGLTLPDYLECRLFPETPDPNICVGYEEVKEAKRRAQTPVCPTGFQCDISRCLPKDWQCDGHVDCKDQSDELNCKKCGLGMIHCGANRCITQEHMCDGRVDCPYGQDERNCLRLSERNGDEGRGQLEVFRPDMEKWVPACIQHWDQNTSPKYICSLLGYSTVSRTQLIRGTDLQNSPRLYDSAWQFHKMKRSKNLIRQFGSCNGTNYPTVEMSCTKYICGKARKSYAEKRRTTRIIGGTRSKPGDWPFLAALLGGPEEIFYCAGVLIADQWVLTASHCVGNHSDVSGWTIQLGITRRHSHAFYGQKMKVKRVVPHPMYNLGIAHDNDVALFQLSSRVTFHEHLLPVCLPEAERQLEPGTLCTVIGWGKKEDNGMSEYEPEINQVEVPVLNRDLCNLWLEHRDLNVTDGMICAGYKEGGKDACQGDSGGPLLCREKNDPERWFVGGIVSWGIKCAHPHLPGVYAYVPKFIPWIKEQMKLYSE
ncbi:atrial natriuretic peptide-converting enzyme [Coccinella septempunctata]|uniref:atrial natriuretic peptide-converting enzyme n=1 Tax=Coccinella septempunctata TaxID=41139 RepID=UPI001D05CD5A|nr:atrial natriuretic peptide-converting enzyme [Coccinella septempunctata]XP_044766096.1 atrial natriuretic peptide-converting enzyme [Coccinella septempunctata]XP_044766097.1 atrial natriuretic peptide-converting enzyme [Coccinella septempunctata]